MTGLVGSLLSLSLSRLHDICATILDLESVSCLYVQPIHRMITFPGSGARHVALCRVLDIKGDGRVGEVRSGEEKGKN
jgi:hypothetical protein